MSATNFAPSKQMPQIDFGQAFAGSEEVTVASVPSALPATPVSARAPTRERNVPLSRSGLTNISFVTLTVTGGLFCAFYFFNGADLLRAAAAWPGELLYGRPLALAERGKIDNYGLPVDLRSTSETNSDSNSGPFRRSAQSLLTPNQSPNQPFGLVSPATGATAGPSAPASGVPLDQLPLQPPGGDALMQTFDRAVADLQQATINNAHAVVVVVEKRSTKATQRVRSAAKKLNKNTRGIVTKAGAQSQQTATRTTTSASSQSGAAQNQINNSIRSTSNISQSGIGGVRNIGGLSGLGGGGGIHAPVSLGGIGGHH